MSESASRPSAIRERIVRQAVAEFSTRALTEVKITEIARPLGLASQAVYRYFKNREELFEAALVADYHQLIDEVFEAGASNPLMMVSGAGWYLMTEHIPNHPFLQRVLIQRDANHLRPLAEAAETSQLIDRIVEEARAAQKYGVIREDVDVALIADATRPILLQVMLPLLAEKKYNGPEWQGITALTMAAYFHPVPDTSTPEGVASIEASFGELAKRMLSA